jgi:hypothetical protein
LLSPLLLGNGGGFWSGGSSRFSSLFVSWRSFERETRLYLDAEHVADLVRRGACDEAERYLGAFISGVMPDTCSARIFAALRRRKDVEAIDR